MTLWSDRCPAAPQSTESWTKINDCGRELLFRELDGHDREVRDPLSDRGCELPLRRCDHVRVYVRVNAHGRGRGSVRGRVSYRHENVRGYGCACDHGRVNAHVRGCLALGGSFFSIDVLRHLRRSNSKVRAPTKFVNSVAHLSIPVALNTHVWLNKTWFTAINGINVTLGDVVLPT